MGVSDERFLEMANDLAKCSDCGHCNHEDFCSKCELVGAIETYELRFFYERIGELAEAMQRGRLVELPCKVGDEIFSFRWSIKNQKYEVFTGKVKNVRYDSVDSSVTVSDGEFYRVWGKTVFLTREEATEALEKEGGK